MGYLFFQSPTPITDFPPQAFWIFLHLDFYFSKPSTLPTVLSSNYIFFHCRSTTHPFFFPHIDTGPLLRLTTPSYSFSYVPPSLFYLFVDISLLL